MKSYTHLSFEEREKLYMLLKTDLSRKAIALKMGRDRSTIYREIKRNIAYSKRSDYLPDTAQRMSETRIARHGTKISRHPELKDIIRCRMRDDRFSQEMIAGRLKHQRASVTISTEAIYEYIYSKEGLEKELYRFLMRARRRRNQRYGRKTRSNYGIPDRVSISQRPPIDPSEFDHFEADLTFFSGSGRTNLLTMVDRKTGYLIADLNSSKDSTHIACTMLKNLIFFPRNIRKSVTMDNGKEFVKHQIVRAITGTHTYFCHPGAPWEKPYVETTHALLHRFLPKNTDPRTLTQERVHDAVTKLNNLPRKRFKFQTPAEMIAKENIFKCGALRA